MPSLRRIRPSHHPRRPHRRILAAAALALASGLAAAAPADGSDAVGRLLAEKGLVDASVLPAAAAPPAETTFVRQVRDKASDMVLSAMNFLGVPYRRGGSSADKGFDCSGFTRHIFELSLGLVLPRRVDEQASAPGLVKVRRDELEPGDLVFFNTLKRTFSHVGIYIGEGKFIHSPRSGSEVRVEDMRYAYWNKRFTGARRAQPLETGTAAAMPAPAAAATPTPAATDTETYRTLY